MLRDRTYRYLEGKVSLHYSAEISRNAACARIDSLEFVHIPSLNGGAAGKNSSKLAHQVMEINNYTSGDDLFNVLRHK